jgi:hypothetical protein
MGMKSLRHVVHIVALTELLRAGPVADFDVDHYWNFVDSTYVDDVSTRRKDRPDKVLRNSR